MLDIFPEHLHNDFYAMTNFYRNLVRKNQYQDAVIFWNTFISTFRVSKRLKKEYSELIHSLYRSAKEIYVDNSSLDSKLTIPQFVEGTIPYFAIFPKPVEAAKHLEKAIQDYFPQDRVIISLNEPHTNLHLYTVNLFIAFKEPQKDFKRSEFLEKMKLLVDPYIGYNYFPEQTWNLESGNSIYERRWGNTYLHKGKYYTPNFKIIYVSATDQSTPYDINFAEKIQGTV